jgi:small subunit ribosomal protein S21
MLVVKVKKGENIDRALKRYRYKVIQTKQLVDLKEGREYEKPSQKKRKKIAKSQIQ